jgi:hypothetical protein
MTVALQIPEEGWTAERFLTTDQREFGEAWRYELVDGRIVWLTPRRRPSMAPSWPD